MHGIRLRLRKSPVVLRIGEDGQLRSNKRPRLPRPGTKATPRSASIVRDSRLCAAKIFQLFPDCELVDACQVRSEATGAESFRAMAMFATLRQQHSTKSISRRSRCHASPASTPHRRDAVPVRVARQQRHRELAISVMAVSHAAIHPAEDLTVIAPHSSPFLPAARQETALAAQPSTRTAWRSVPLRKIRGNGLIFSRRGNRSSPR